jgi:glutamate synthase (NADPH/NADH) small chain
MAPVAVSEHDGTISVELARTRLGSDGRLTITDDVQTLQVDTVFKAIGQKLVDDVLAGIKLKGGRIIIDDAHATTLNKVWAGGDCVVGGEDLTVSAVQHGKIAAIAIDRSLRHG